MIVKEESGLFYIDQTGAYLQEHDLFRTYVEAKDDACNKLNKFYYEKLYEIMNRVPRKDKF